MSQRDRDRLVVVRQMAEKGVTVTRGAELMGVSRRQAHRILKRFREIGDEAVIHASRGKPPNNSKSEAIRARTLERAREPVYQDFGPTLLAEHLSRDSGTGPLNLFTLRKWRWGRPVAFYTDKAGHFGQWTRPKGRIERDFGTSHRLTDPGHQAQAPADASASRPRSSLATERPPHCQAAHDRQAALHARRSAAGAFDPQPLRTINRHTHFALGHF